MGFFSKKNKQKKADGPVTREKSATVVAPSKPKPTQATPAPTTQAAPAPASAPKAAVTVPQASDARSRAITAPPPASANATNKAAVQEQKQQNKKDSRENPPFDSPDSPYALAVEDRYSRPFGYGVDTADLKKKGVRKESPKHLDLSKETPDMSEFFKSWEISQMLGLSEAQVKDFAQYFRSVKAADGNVLVQLGNTARSECFLVYEGELKVDFGGEQGTRLLKKGDYFGEFSLTLEVMPRCYTITAQGPCQLFALSYRGLQDFLSKDSSGRLTDRYREYKMKHVSAQLKTMDVDFFKHIPANHVSELLDEAELTEVLPGETYCLADDPAHTFDFVLSGELTIRDGPSLLPGHHFSEIALASVIPRPVTIEGKNRTLILSLYGVDFASLFSGKPQVYSNLAMQLAQEHTPLLPVLLHPMGKAYFTNHLESCWSERHVKFFNAVQQYKTISDPETMMHAANAVSLQFLSPESVDQINISANTRAKIQWALQKATESPAKYGSRINPQLFATALEEVMGLLSFDHLPEFKTKIDFLNLLGAVGKYKFPASSKRLDNGFRYHGDGNAGNNLLLPDMTALKERLAKA